jgi:hypothetical protein
LESTWHSITDWKHMNINNDNQQPSMILDYPETIND